MSEDKFSIEPTYICVILPEEYTDATRRLWSEMFFTDAYEICPFPLSPIDNREIITHWLCLHESTTLDWRKIEIYVKKNKFVTVPTTLDEITSFCPVDGDLKGFMGTHAVKEILFEKSLEFMKLTVASAKLRRKYPSYKKMKERQEFIKNEK